MQTNIISKSSFSSGLLAVALAVSSLAGQDRIHSPSTSLSVVPTDYNGLKAAFDSVYFSADSLWAAKKLASVDSGGATMGSATWDVGSWGRGYYTYQADERDNYDDWYEGEESAHPLYRDGARLLLGYSGAYFSGLNTELDSYDLLSTRVAEALQYLADQMQSDSTYIWWRYRDTLSDTDSDDLTDTNSYTHNYDALPYVGSLAIRALTEGAYLLDELGGYSSLRSQIADNVLTVATKLTNMPEAVIANRNPAGGGANVNYRGFTIWALVGAYKLLDDDQFKERAWEIAESLLYPSQGSFLQADGSWQRAGTYHDAKIHYHGITLRGFAELYSVLTDQTRKDTVLSAIIKNINHVMDYNGTADDCGHAAVRLVQNAVSGASPLYTLHICDPDTLEDPYSAYRSWGPQLITGLITAREAILQDITAADVDRIDALIDYLAFRLANLTTDLVASNTVLADRQQITHALGLYLLWKENLGPPDTPELGLKHWLDDHPLLYWSDGGEPDLDHFVLKRQVSSPNYITVFGHSYIDTDYVIRSGGFTIHYWVKAVDESGLCSPYSNEVSALVLVLIGKAIAGRLEEPLPERYDLTGNQPNPFNPSTSILYELPQASRVSLTIYDIMGREVNNHAALEEAGYRSVTWQGRDRAGRALPSGIYI